MRVVLKKWTNYYRRFVKGFAHIANPLNAPTKKVDEFEWTKACSDDFDKFKHALVSCSVSFPFC